MTLHSLHLQPRDLLFFRDARPMTAADLGSGAHWPLPSLVHDALTNWFHRLWPEHQEWEHRHTKTEADNPSSSDRFGCLQTAGPFPARGDTVLLPTPADLVGEDDAAQLMAPAHLSAATNLPSPLRYPVASLARPTKSESPPFLALADYAQYLAGHPVAFRQDHAPLFAQERQIGIALDPLTHATEEGRFYSAEYLRLADTVTLVVYASARYRNPRDQETDLLALATAQDPYLVLGGQQGVARIHLRSVARPELPRSVAPAEVTRVKWVLLTPAVFPAISPGTDGQGQPLTPHPGGWLPTWVNPENGQVLLKAGDTSRRPGEHRTPWRNRVRTLPAVAAHLVAARIPKPVVFSGWSLRDGGPKPTHLAVPAGAVYYFEAVNPAAARELVTALAWDAADPGMITNRRSTLLGEQGFGLGVCAPWDFLPLPVPGVNPSPTTNS